MGGFALGLLIDSLFTPIGEMTLNDQVLEQIYEDVIAEATETETIHMYSQEDINREVMNSFHALTP